MTCSCFTGVCCQKNDTNQSEIRMNDILKPINTEFRDQLYKEANQKNWENCIRLVNEDAYKAEEIFQPYTETRPKTTYNILHCVIRENDDAEEAAEIIKDIYKCALELEFIGDFENTIIEFTNFRDNNQESPLDITLKRKYYKVVEVLLDNCADVSLDTQRTLFEEYQNLVLKIYDRGIRLECSPCNINDQGWWSLEYDFEKIIGIRGKIDGPNDEYRETRLLAKTLSLSRERRIDLMLHPLVQMFVGKKYKKYNWLIVFSIYYHIIWSLMSAAYFICVNTVVTTENLSNSHNASTNVSTEIEPNVAKLCTALELENKSDFNFMESGYFFWGLVFVSLFSFVKEFYELCTCPSSKYYWNQFENIGQWTTIAVLALSFVVLFLPKGILIIPLCFFLASSIILEGRKFCKFHFEKKYFLHFESFGKWVIIGTALSVYFVPEVSIWLWFCSTLVYIFCPLTSLVVVKIFLVIYGCFTSLTTKSFKDFWAQLNSIIRWITILVQLFQLSFIPFEQPWTNIVSSLACSIGIAASVFLIQGQLTKTETYGVYNQMMMKGFKILTSFLATFFPIMAAYFVIFIILLPSNDNFSLKNGIGVGKIVAMLTGDLGFDDIFSAENIQLIPFVISANIALIFFAITVVLLLQNLLIGLTVDDLKKLRRKATAAHVANRLEVINLLEKFIMSNCMLWLLQKIKLHDLVTEQLSVRSSAGPTDKPSIKQGPVKDHSTQDERDGLLKTANISVSKNFWETIKFTQLPKSVKEVILENQGSYLK